MKQNRLLKKTCAVVLAVFMLISLLPAVVFAEDEAIADNSTASEAISEAQEENRPSTENADLPELEDAPVTLNEESADESKSAEPVGEKEEITAEEKITVTEGTSNPSMNGLAQGTQAEIVDSGTCGENVTWTLDSDGLLTLSGNGEIHESDYPWKAYNGLIDSIIIDSGITTVPDQAFTFMPDVEYVYLSETVEKVTSMAFDGSCMEIIVSENNPTFASKDGMLLDKSCKTLYSWPSAKGDVIIPDGIETIAYEAFFHPFYYSASFLYQLEEITSVVFPKSVVEVDYGAFAGRYEIETIRFENDNTAIGAHAFSLCTSLKNVRLPKYLKMIEEATFQGCAFTNIDIPLSVRLIDDSAFKLCVNLNNVAIPKNVKEIGRDAFVNCKSLTDIIIPGSVKQIGGNCFLGTPFQEQHIINDMLIINNLLVSYTGTDETVVVPEGITDTCEAFFWNTNVKTVVLPKSLTTLSCYFAFFGGYDENNHRTLNTVIFQGGVPDNGNSRWASWENDFFWANDHAVIYYPANGEGWDDKDFSYWDDNIYPGLERVVKEFHIPYCYLDNDNIPVLEHNPKIVCAKAATCTEEGKTEGSHCTVCGKVIKAQEVIPAIGHKWSEWKIIKEATTTEEGLEERVCLNDPSHKETRKIEKTEIRNGLYNDGGKWKYFENDVFTKKTGIVQRPDNGKYYYVDKGVYKKLTGLAQRLDNKKWYYVENGVFSKKTGVTARISDGKLFYVKAGSYDKSFSGLAQGIGTETKYFMNKGQLNNVTGLYNTDGTWRYFEGGVFTEANGIVQRPDNGKYYYVDKGVYKKSTGLAQRLDNKKWYYVEKGIFTKKTGAAKRISDGKWFYVENGIFKKATGLAKRMDNNDWYYFKAGSYYKHDGKATKINGDGTLYDVVKGKMIQ